VVTSAGDIFRDVSNPAGFCLSGITVSWIDCEETGRKRPDMRSAETDTDGSRNGRDGMRVVICDS